MSTETKETLDQRIERELSDLRDRGIVEKAPPTITRSTLDRLSLQEQAAFFKAGGKITNDPPPERKPLPKGAVTRSTWQKLSPQESSDFFKKGGFLVDDDSVLPGPTSTDVITRSAFRELPVREQVQFLDAGGTVTD